MKVIAYPADRFACGHYRVVWPAQAVAADGGFEVTVVPPGGSSGIQVLQLDGKASSISIPECDVVIFQRPARRIISEMIPLLRAKGIAVIVDVDDDLERIHPRNPAFKGMHPALSPDYNWRHLREACAVATMVTVSTPALMPRYGAHGRVRLLRNLIPEKFLDEPHDVSNDSPGWAGSLHSHPDDLKPASMALSKLNAEGHKLRFVGPVDGLEAELGTTLDEDACTGNLDFGEWHPAIAARIGVGAAPLAPTTFNEAKSWLKPLEYSAVGVPWVASDTPEYRRLAKMCGAPLATRPREWYRELRTLVEDGTRRGEASEAVRETARALTIEGGVHMWAEAWESAVQAERASARQRC